MKLKESYQKQLDEQVIYLAQEINKHLDADKVVFMVELFSTVGRDHTILERRFYQEVVGLVSEMLQLPLTITYWTNQLTQTTYLGVSIQPKAFE